MKEKKQMQLPAVLTTAVVDVFVVFPLEFGFRAERHQKCVRMAWAHHALRDHQLKFFACTDTWITICIMLCVLLLLFGGGNS